MLLFKCIWLSGGLINLVEGSEYMFYRDANVIVCCIVGTKSHYVIVISYVHACITLLHAYVYAGSFSIRKYITNDIKVWLQTVYIYIWNVVSDIRYTNALIGDRLIFLSQWENILTRHNTPVRQLWKCFHLGIVMSILTLTPPPRSTI